MDASPAPGTTAPARPGSSAQDRPGPLRRSRGPPRGPRAARASRAGRSGRRAVLHRAAEPVLGADLLQGAAHRVHVEDPRRRAGGPSGRPACGGVGARGSPCRCRRAVDAGAGESARSRATRPDGASQSRVISSVAAAVPAVRGVEHQQACEVGARQVGEGQHRVAGRVGGHRASRSSSSAGGRASRRRRRSAHLVGHVGLRTGAGCRRAARAGCPGRTRPGPRRSSRPRRGRCRCPARRRGAP